MEGLWCGDCQTFHPDSYFTTMNNDQARGRKFKQPRCIKAQSIRHEKWRKEQEIKAKEKIGQLDLFKNLGVQCTSQQA